MNYKSLATRSLISGDTATIPYYAWEGAGGPSVYIQAGIHGQELMGYGIAHCLIEYFKKNPPKGRVTIVPKANPYGMNMKIGETTYGRFDPTTGDNWNRNYVNWLKNPEDLISANAEGSKSWEDVKTTLRCEARQILEETTVRSYPHKLALQLQSLAVQHDIMLDLHCDGVSLPYVYCHDHSLDYAKRLGFDYHIITPYHFKGSFDNALMYPFWTIYQQMGFPLDQFDMMAFTLELGNKEYFELAQCQKFSDQIIHFLEAPYKKEPQHNAHVCPQDQFVDIYSPQAGMLYDFAPLGKSVPAGQPLCFLLATDNRECSLEERIIPITCPTSCLPLARTIAGSVHEGSLILSATALPSIY